MPKSVILTSVTRSGVGQATTQRGRLRVQEQYLSDAAIFTTGLTRISELSRKQHYLLVSRQVLQDYLPLLEQLDVTKKDRPLIVLQSVLRPALTEAPSRAFRKKLGAFLIHDHSALYRRYIFLDEVCSMCSIGAGAGTSPSREALFRALMYLAHGNELDYTVLCDDEKDEFYEVAREAGQRCIKIETLVNQIQVDTSQLQLLYEQCKSRRTTSATSQTPLFPVHMSHADALEGIKAGRLQLGVFRASKLYSSLQAVVEIRGPQQQSALISGSVAMNRALDGDLVAIELTAEEESFMEQKSLLIETHADDAADEVSTQQLSSEHPRKSSLSTLLPLAKVVGIISRRMDTVIARVPDKLESEQQELTSSLNRSASLLVTPLRGHLPRFRIRTRKSSELQGKLVSIRIHPGAQAWPRNSSVPEASVVDVLIASPSWKAYQKALLLDQGIPASNSFSLAARSCLPTVIRQDSRAHDADASLPPLEPSQWIKDACEDTAVGILDLRDLTIFSVDPQGCQDIDDAMHVRWHPALPGTLILVIAIADVSSFVRSQTALDAEARARATTVYLPNERLDMLPSLLSANICSLHAGVDRQAVAIQWHVRVTYVGTGKIVNHGDNPPEGDLCTLERKGVIAFDFGTPILEHCGKALIHSRAALTYEQGYELLQNLTPCPTANEAGVAGNAIPTNLWLPLRKQLQILTALSRSLLRNRLEGQGHAVQPALQINHGTEIRFHTDDAGQPIGMTQAEHIEIHDTVAELMILSNNAVAKLIHKWLPRGALLRIHQPSVRKLQDVRELLGVAGSTEGAADGIKAVQKLQDEAEKMLRSGEISEEVMKLVSSTIIRGVQEATYVPAASVDSEAEASAGSALLHAGLGLAHYTHFTSPIRRYADLVVHRQLLHVLQLSKNVNGGNLATEPISQTMENESRQFTSSTPPTAIDGGDDSGSDFSDLDALLECVGEDLQSTADTVQNAPKGGGTALGVQSVDAVRGRAVAEKRDTIDFGTQKSVAEILEVTKHLNDRTRAAREVSRKSEEMFLRLYLSGLPPQRTTAVIYSLRDNGFLATVPAFNVRLPVYLVTKDQYGTVLLADSCLSSTGDHVEKERMDLQLKRKLRGESANKDTLCVINAEDEVVLELQTLQTVSVELSCHGSNISSGLPEFKLTLQGVRGSGPSSKSEIGQIVQSVLSNEGKPLQHDRNSSLRTMPLKNLSFAELIKRFHPSHRTTDSGVGGSLSTRTAAILRKHKVRPHKDYSVRIASGGRVFYGGTKVLSQETVPPAYRDVFTKGEFSKCNTSNVDLIGGNKEGLASSNIERARARMAAQGEAWAEEVDLPGVRTTADATGSTDPFPHSVGVSSRDVRLAASRLDKVKTAKRNAKFKR